MYNGIGLTTPRGSGTNGHVQRNWALVRPGKKDNTTYKPEEDIKKLDASLNRPPNKEILDHDRKRKIEVKCIEFEEILEKQGRTPEEIKSKVDSYRQKLMGQGKTDLPKDEFGRITVRDTHKIAEAQQEKNAKLREAFNISEYFVEGSSFDSDRLAKEDLAKSLALQKELDAQREADAAAAAGGKEKEKRYALVRTPSKETNAGAASGGVGVSGTKGRNVSGGGGGDNCSADERGRVASKSDKKKKRKRTRDDSASPERKKDKKKKSKKHKKESKSKKKKSHKRKNSDTATEDSEKESDNDDDDGSSSDSECNLKKRSKKSKKEKKKHDKRKKKGVRSSSTDASRSRSPQNRNLKQQQHQKKSHKLNVGSEQVSQNIRNPFRSRSRERLPHVSSGDSRRPVLSPRAGCSHESAKPRSILRDRRSKSRSLHRYERSNERKRKVSNDRVNLPRDESSVAEKRRRYSRSSQNRRSSSRRRLSPERRRDRRNMQRDISHQSRRRKETRSRSGSFKPKHFGGSRSRSRSIKRNEKRSVSRSAQRCRNTETSRSRTRTLQSQLNTKRSRSHSFSRRRRSRSESPLPTRKKNVTPPETRAALRKPHFNPFKTVAAPTRSESRSTSKSNPFRAAESGNRNNSLIPNPAVFKQKQRSISLDSSNSCSDAPRNYSRSRSPVTRSKRKSEKRSPSRKRPSPLSRRIIRVTSALDPKPNLKNRKRSKTRSRSRKRDRRNHGTRSRSLSRPGYNREVRRPRSRSALKSKSIVSHKEHDRRSRSPNRQALRSRSSSASKRRPSVSHKEYSRSSRSRSKSRNCSRNRKRICISSSRRSSVRSRRSSSMRKPKSRTSTKRDYRSRSCSEQRNQDLCISNAKSKSPHDRHSRSVSVGSRHQRRSPPSRRSSRTIAKQSMQVATGMSEQQLRDGSKTGRSPKDDSPKREASASSSLMRGTRRNNCEEETPVKEEGIQPEPDITRMQSCSRSSHNSSELSYSPAVRNPERYRDILDQVKNKKQSKCNTQSEDCNKKSERPERREVQAKAEDRRSEESEEETKEESMIRAEIINDLEKRSKRIEEEAQSESQPRNELKRLHAAQGEKLEEKSNDHPSEREYRGHELGIRREIKHTLGSRGERDSSTSRLEKGDIDRQPYEKRSNSDPGMRSCTKDANKDHYNYSETNKPPSGNTIINLNTREHRSREPNFIECYTEKDQNKTEEGYESHDHHPEKATNVRESGQPDPQYGRELKHQENDELDSGKKVRNRELQSKRPDRNSSARRSLGEEDRGRETCGRERSSEKEQKKQKEKPCGHDFSSQRVEEVAQGTELLPRQCDSVESQSCEKGTLERKPYARDSSDNRPEPGNKDRETRECYSKKERKDKGFKREEKIKHHDSIEGQPDRGKDREKHGKQRKHGSSDNRSGKEGTIRRERSSTDNRHSEKKDKELRRRRNSPDSKESLKRLIAAPVVHLQGEDESDNEESITNKADIGDLEEFQSNRREQLKDLKMLEQLKSGLAAKAKEKIKTIKKMASASAIGAEPLVAALTDSALVDTIVSKVSTATVAAAESAARRSRSRSRRSSRDHPRKRNGNSRRSKSRSMSSHYSSSSSRSRSHSSRSHSRFCSHSRSHSSRSSCSSRSSSRSSSSSSSSSNTGSRSPSIPRRRGSPSFLDRRRITSKNSPRARRR